jgi:hypothetical protein
MAWKSMVRQTPIIWHCQVNGKSLPDAFPLRKAEGAGITKIQGLVKVQNPL